MIDRYGITDEAVTLMLQVAPNLMTIESKKLSNGQSYGDERFKVINERLEKEDLKNKIMILKKYEDIF